VQQGLHRQGGRAKRRDIGERKQDTGNAGSMPPICHRKSYELVTRRVTNANSTAEIIIKSRKERM
jgi:hypothetical protein